MTPPASTAAPRARARPGAANARAAQRRRPAPASARRRPAGSRAVPRPAVLATPSATAVAAPLGARALRWAAALPDARLLDRLARGRVWIALLAASLVGIVFLQISLLKLNTGISRAVETQQTLERQNAALKTDLSRLGGGQRVQDSAAAMGFVAPASGQPRFVDARRASARRAAANITPPAPIEQLPLGMLPPSEGGTGAGPGADPASATAPVPAAATPVVAPAVVTPAAAAAPGQG